jgi:uncharacterized metal-binding protein YceD (DUF177 family)
MTGTGHSPNLAAVFYSDQGVYAERPLLPKHEFSRKLAVEPWPEAAIDLVETADPVDRDALARRFGLLEVTSFCGRGRLERLEGQAELVFRGWLEADVVQSCVICLEPVPTTIRRPIERRYRPGGAHAAARDRGVPTGAVDVDDLDDEVEVLSGRDIDLGGVFAEELGLALDPYPRAPGATAVVAEALSPYVSVGQTESRTPFAGLRSLQEKHAR